MGGVRGGVIPQLDDQTHSPSEGDTVSSLSSTHWKEEFPSFLSGVGGCVEIVSVSGNGRAQPSVCLDVASADISIPAACCSFPQLLPAQGSPYLIWLKFQVIFLS